MTEENKELQTQNTAIIPAAMGGFSEEEASCGMGPIQTGYMKSFPYFLRTKGSRGQFELTDNSTGEVIWTGEKIERAIIYFGHQVWQFREGHRMGLTTDSTKWSDDEKALLALSYDAKSRGNFDARGYGEYLGKEYKDLHVKMKRFYFFFIASSLLSKHGVVGASTGITSVKGFTNYRKEIDRLAVNGEKANFPLPFVTCDICFEDAKTEDNQDYVKVVFNLRKDADGVPEFSFPKGPEQYRSHTLGLPMLNNILNSHRAAVAIAENDEIDMGFSGGSSDSIKTIEAVATSTEQSEIKDDDDTPF